MRIGLILALTCFFLACSSPSSPKPRQTAPSPATSTRPETIEGPRPPWQLWLSESPDHPLGKGDALDAGGRLEDAAKVYRDIEVSSPPGRLREEAFARRIGIFLKLGQSRTALDQITKHLKDENLNTDQISPILAMLAAYSYVHLGDFDQALAWFGVVLKKAEPRSVVSRRTRAEVDAVLRTIPAAAFPNAYQVWTVDPQFAEAFQREKTRRSQGAQPDPKLFAKWFSPTTYGARAGTTLQESDLSLAASGPPPIPTGLSIGVVLPESGKYAEHAARVRRGIELAVADSGQAGNIQVTFADSGGDPGRAEAEYERLARESGAAIVLGELLVKSSEQMAKKSEEIGVPFLTFTKRPGMTTLSRVGFRLGATTENQASELAQYVTGQLNLRRVAVLVPQDGGAGEEFAAAFRAAMAEAGGAMAGESAYAPGNPDSIARAVQSLGTTGAQAVFIPEDLDAALPVIQALRNSELRNAVLLGPAVWNDAVAVRGFGNLLEGAVVVTPFFVTSALPQVSEFVSRYRQAYQSEPELLGAQAYDATRIVITALQNTPPGTADFREKFIQNLKSVDTLAGATGRLSVQDNGEITRRMSVLRLHDGELLEVMAGGTVTGFIPDESKTNQAAADKT